MRRPVLSWACRAAATSYRLLHTKLAPEEKCYMLLQGQLPTSINLFMWKLNNGNRYMTGILHLVFLKCVFPFVFFVIGLLSQWSLYRGNLFCAAWKSRWCQHWQHCQLFVVKLLWKTRFLLSNTISWLGFLKDTRNLKFLPRKHADHRPVDYASVVLLSFLDKVHVF